MSTFALPVQNWQIDVNERYAGTCDDQNHTIVTRDGTELTCRLMQPSDAPLLVDLFHRLSPESKRRRFHYPIEIYDDDALLEAATRLADVDNRTQGGAVVALEQAADGEHIVAVARLMRPAGKPNAPDVEAAITVRDDYQGRGLGTEMLRRMVLLAKRMQATTIVAEIEADNYAAVRLFRELNLVTVSSTTHGETTMRMEVPT
jgi:acetyltransferase